MRRSPLSRALALVILSSFSLMGHVHAGQDVHGNPVKVLGHVVPIDSPDTYYSDIHPCPLPCLDTKPDNWTVYTSTDRLALCNQPVLFSLAIRNPVDDPDTVVKLRACTAGSEAQANTTTNALFEALDTSSSSPSAKVKRASTTCLSAVEETELSLDFSQKGSSSSSEQNKHILTAVDLLQNYLERDADCDENPSTLFAYANGTVAGIYLGPSFDKRTTASLTDSLADQVNKAGDEPVSETLVVQLCGNQRNANHIAGLVVNTASDVGLVQRTLKSWADAECVVYQGSGGAGGSSTIALDGVKVWESNADLKPLVVRPSNSSSSTLHRRGDCTTINVVAGDGCDTLASRCGVSGSDFTQFNPGDDFCSSLVPGQRVCCSAGTLPDISPKPNADGTCANYLVVDNDSCDSLAASNGLTIEQIESFNQGTTWGWMGCDNLLTGVLICLSTGNPPMPAPIDNAICGPLKPGTVAISGVALADLNPCPLNACCNIWGQCGITDEFCVKIDGPTGNPGTSPPGTAGCISSCGTSIVNNGQGPSNYGRVGYYESWNFDRDCLKQRAGNANTDGSYTHMHWAFATINSADWTIVIEDPGNQWEEFKGLSSKRIVSFGGWGYSTEPETYDILREAMGPANRATFAANIAAFLTSEGLDGVDFDWEYPGAMDIPGTPAGLASDGPNYLKFLTTMRSSLPSGKTMSIAAPSSYWYLKGFPISSMANQLDYIVFMTYDLHGQWDAGNIYASPGCPTGNCLRSHVNLTETYYALSMITKAGVATNKIFVGESSYGRSFLMSQAGCTGPACTFEGDWLDSPAELGRCTQEAGYIANAEIEEILHTSDNAQSWYDYVSASDMAVWNDVQWVAYMSPATKSARRDLWRQQNFAGTIDWAVDLQEFTEDDYYDPTTGDDDEIDEPDAAPWPDCNGSYSSLDAIEADRGNIPDHCVPLYILVVLKATLDDALTRYDSLMSGGYDSSFNIYAEAVVNSGSKVVDQFMADHGNDYFTCVVTETVYCCSLCDYRFGADNVNCRYCQDFDCGWSPSCEHTGGEATTTPCPNIEVRYQNFTEPCPPDYSLRGETTPAAGYRWTESVYWTLRDDRSSQFWADLYTDTGIAQENIAFQNVEREECAEPSSDHCNDQYHDYNFPVPQGYSKDDVLNPKDLVSSARDKLSTLGPQMSQVIDLVRMGSYLADPDELVDAVSLPIYMISEAVENMQQINDIAEDIREEKRKAIILAFLSAIFFFVPIVGEIATSITALATIGRIISIIGATGNAALDIYTLVDDPANAPLAIFSLVLAPLALTDFVAISKAAKARRGMKAESIKALGDTISGRMDTIGRIKNICRY